MVRLARRFRVNLTLLAIATGKAEDIMIIEAVRVW